MRQRFRWRDRLFQVEVVQSDPLEVRVDEEGQSALVMPQGVLRPGSGRLLLDGAYLPYFVTRDRDGIWVSLDGDTQFLEFAKRHGDVDAEQESGFVAPMPGKIVKVNINPGDKVEKRAVLVVMEAMKMEHRIEAPAAGVVTALHVGEGDVVPMGFHLLEFTPDSG